MTRFASIHTILLTLILPIWVTIEVRAEEPTGRVNLSLPSPVSQVPPAPSTNFLLDDDSDSVYLPPLEEELRHHGGSYLYEPLDTLSSRYPQQSKLTLPENWQEPQPPISLPKEYLGVGFIDWKELFPNSHLFPYMTEPRLVAHGSYEVFGAYHEHGGIERNGIGHQLLIDLDYALSGTERFHVQFRPLGEENTGGSFWQFNNPDGYFDNSTAIPQRYWFEGELQSLFGPWGGDPNHNLDINVTLGRFLFRLHNGLLMNDEILGVVVGKNNILSTPMSNINLQLFYAPDEVDTSPADSHLYGVHISADYQHWFFEGTYAYLDRSETPEFSAHYLAGSATQFFGSLTLAGRSMYRLEDSGTGEDGHLQVVESNYTRIPGKSFQSATGIEKTVTYLNLFYAEEDWQSISGGGFNRLRNAFAVDPLLNIAAVPNMDERFGVSCGVQLFRHHQDESLVPEGAWERRESSDVWGIGLRYQRKICPRAFLEVNGVRNWSDNPIFDRKGILASTTVIF